MEDILQGMKASEIFLRLWHYRTRNDGDETTEDFRLCANAHAWIVAAEEARKAADEEFARIFGLTGIVDTDTSRTVYAKAEMPLPAKVEQDPGANTVTADAELPEEPAPAPKPKAKVTDLAKKKTRIRAELGSRRETGTGLQDVVDASRGRVTMAMLLDALDAMPLTVAQWEDIGKAIKAAKIKKTWADKEAAPE